MDDQNGGGRNRWAVKNLDSNHPIAQKLLRVVKELWYADSPQVRGDTPDFGLAIYTEPVKPEAREIE
jgi:hypothetical protein